MFSNAFVCAHIAQALSVCSPGDVLVWKQCDMCCMQGCVDVNALIS